MPPACVCVPTAGGVLHVLVLRAHITILLEYACRVVNSPRSVATSSLWIAHLGCWCIWVACWTALCLVVC